MDTSEYAYVKCSVDGLGRSDADLALVLTGSNEDFGLVFQVYYRLFVYISLNYRLTMYL